jgi:hypothetical protein
MGRKSREKKGRNRTYENDADRPDKKTMKFVYMVSLILFIPTCYGFWNLYKVGRAIPECILFLILAVIFHWGETMSIAYGKIHIKTAGIGLIQRPKEPFRFWFHMFFGIIIYIFFFWVSPIFFTH